MTATPTVKGRTFDYASAQDMGQRNNQEDHYAIRQFTTTDGREALLALVADGIGGHNRGEVASEIASQSVPAHLTSQAPEARQVGQALRASVEKAGHDIYEASLSSPAREGMGTTCTAVAIVDARLYLSHVGDTRLYLLHRNALRQLSIDHTWGEDAIRAGFPPEEIRRHPNRGVLKRYLGIDPTVDVDTRYRLTDDGQQTGDSLVDQLLLEPSDVLMLCSDGVANALEQGDIARILGSGDPGKAATGLVQRALQAGATDNLTVVVLRLSQRKSGLRAYLAGLLASVVPALALVPAAILLAARLNAA